VGKVIEVQWLLVHAQNAFAQNAQGVETLFNRDESGVGDGIGGACEQVGHADLAAHRAGQDSQRRVERARDLPEQIGKQVRRVRTHVSLAKHERPPLVRRVYLVPGIACIAGTANARDELVRKKTERRPLRQRPWHALRVKLTPQWSTWRLKPASVALASEAQT
jgi:hypothetical protein